MDVVIKIVLPTRATVTPVGKLADAELLFNGGLLAGTKLVGFGIWSRSGAEISVSLPSRNYEVAGEKRSYALLRPVEDIERIDDIKAQIIKAFREVVGATADPMRGA